MVFYRKYRPQKIAELDSEAIREKLSVALSGKSIPHAFLFTGPKGLGKTSTARIMAKAVNCQQKAKSKKQKEDIEPCNKCDQCLSITSGTNLDVLEIDGASNRGIDEIRDLRDKIRLSPISAKNKVYIIDEVHMLTTEAFNALLKTLEEPPSHAIFILCTTEPHKVPQTIASRCFPVAFTRATELELVRSFSKIVKGEKLNVDKDALSLIASLSDGSFRDGAKILEEIARATGRKKITKELVEQKYKVSNIQYQVSNILESLQKKDAKAGLHLVGKLVDQGVDIKYFIEQMVSQLHEILLVRVGIKNSELNLEFRIEELTKLVELLSKAHQEIKYAVLPQLPLELAIVEWIAGQNDSLPASEVDRDGKGNSDFWKQFIEKVKQHNHSLAGVLRGCGILRYDEKELIIETPFKFHKEKLEEKKARVILEKVCQEVIGKELKVSIVLTEK